MFLEPNENAHKMWYDEYRYINKIRHVDLIYKYLYLNVLLIHIIITVTLNDLVSMIA